MKSDSLIDAARRADCDVGIMRWALLRLAIAERRLLGKDTTFSHHLPEPYQIVGDTLQLFSKLKNADPELVGGHLGIMGSCLKVAAAEPPMHLTYRKVAETAREVFGHSMSDENAIMVLGDFLLHVWDLIQEVKP